MKTVHFVLIVAILACYSALTVNGKTKFYYNILTKK